MIRKKAFSTIHFIGKSTVKLAMFFRLDTVPLSKRVKGIIDNNFISLDMFFVYFSGIEKVDDYNAKLFCKSSGF